MNRQGETPPPHGWASTTLVIGSGVHRSHSTRVFPQPASPHYSCRFVVPLPYPPPYLGEGKGGGARPARGAVRTRCVLVQYVEGPRGEPAGWRLVVIADRRLQQKLS